MLAEFSDEDTITENSEYQDGDTDNSNEILMSMKTM